ncbi:hypothetical protein AB4076_21525 [Dyella sp. 2RAF44]|uniref:hypothetical protein n=1 Tax=Dyella sp. 2RAF44 TaxID=3233000 RepID=UPI003F906131
MILDWSKWMSRGKLWAAVFVLFVCATAGVVYVWSRHNGANHQSVVDRAISPLPATNPVAAPHPSAANSGTGRYQNVRFGYVVEYPSPLLLAGNEADNGDGLKFAPEMGDADIRVWGEYNVNSDSPAAILKADLTNDCASGKATYQVSKPNLVAYSCLTPQGRVVYAKAIIRGDTLATVRFDYAPSEQQTWAPVIKQMADTLRLDDSSPEPGAR